MVSVAAAVAADTFRAYSDPVIFRDDRVLRTLLKKETRYLPRVANFFSQVQTEVSQTKESVVFPVSILLDKSQNYDLPSPGEGADEEGGGGVDAGDCGS